MLLLFPAVYAQTSASISGTVLDSANALVPNAKVKLTNQANKGTRLATSNDTGFFDFAAVQTGTYTIEIVKDGFETWSVTDIEVHPGDSLALPKIKLTIGVVTQSVTVTAEAAGVTLNSGEHSTLITAADISRLSTTGRDAGELVSILPGFSLMPGVNGMVNGGVDYEQMGFSSGGTSNYGANGAAPQQGLVSVSADGANVTDPGDMGAQTSNINMDQVQEVKVQTSNFGADEAKGPIVINAVGKSGSDVYHGDIHDYFRNSGLNTNDWISKKEGVAKTASRYNFPGGSISGPVKIPGTHFNQSKSMVFFAGFEYYGQVNNANGGYGPIELFVPSAAQLAGDLSNATMAQALNVPGGSAAMLANCPYDYSQTPTYKNIGALCFTPDTDVLNAPNSALSKNGVNHSGLYDEFGIPIPDTGILPKSSIDPGIATFNSFFPTANRTPQPVVAGGQTLSVTDGYNFAKNIMSTHNGFQFHTRVDENISDNLKLYVTYNWEKMNDENPLDYNYNGAGAPLPTPEFTYGFSHYLTLNLTKIIKSNMTNELIGSGLYFDQPEQFANRALASTAGTAWDAAGYSGGHLKNGNKLLPEIYTYENPGIPWYSIANIPPGGWFLKKVSWTVSDNLTIQYRTHSLKIGVYGEQTVNNQSTAGSTENGKITIPRWGGCYVNQAPGATSYPADYDNSANPLTATVDNVLGNYLIGCAAQGYSQQAFDPNSNLRFVSMEGYATDEWKVNSKLTLTLGLRLSHLGPWTDAHGIGLAVWNPATVTKNLIYQNVDINNAKTWPGMSWHQLDSSIPNAGVPTQAVLISPRLGLAYDLRGNGKTTLRGGWGVYYSHDPANNAMGALDTAINLSTYSPNFYLQCTFGQLFTNNYTPCGQFSPGAGSIQSGTLQTVYAMNPKDDQVPTTYNYNFTIDQQAPWHSTIEIAYVGNQSTHLATLGSLENQNVIPLGAEWGPDPAIHSTYYGQTNPAYKIPQIADYRPYPNYSYIDVISHINWSDYNALQASWNKQRGALNFGVNYTRSKALGVRGNWDTGNTSDPVNPVNDYGILAFDRPNVLNAYYSYQEGNKYHGNGILSQVLNQWQISGITSFMSGADLSVWANGSNYGFGGNGGYQAGPVSVNIPLSSDVWLGSNDYTLQPTVTCDPSKGLQKDQYVNGNCFGIPAQGSQGQWNLPDVHGPAFFKSDLTVAKDFKINSRQNLHFALFGQNFLNHPITSFLNNSSQNPLQLQVSDPAGVTYTTPSASINALQISNANVFGYAAYRNGQRIVELSFKYSF